MHGAYSCRGWIRERRNQFRVHEHFCAEGEEATVYSEIPAENEALNVNERGDKR